MSEDLENIRRMAERGLNIALSPPSQSNYADVFQHILDSYTRCKQEPSIPISKLEGLVEQMYNDGDSLVDHYADQLQALIDVTS